MDKTIKKSNTFYFLLLILIIALIFGFFSKQMDKKDNNKPIENIQDNEIAQESVKEEPLKIETKEPVLETSTPIVMYHHIKFCDNNCNDIEKGLSVSPEIFDGQMKYLKENNWESIKLNDLFYKYDQPTIAITFDDGYKDNLTEALPIMKKYELVATIFIISDMVGNEGYLNWDEIKELKNAGWEIGVHSATHPNLATLGTEDLKYQIIEAKKKIDENVGINTNSFSYPAGKYNQEVINIVKEAGLNLAVTTNYDKHNAKDKIFELNRIRINGSDSVEGFIYKINN